MMGSDGNQNNADLGNGARKAVEAVRTPYFFAGCAFRDLFRPPATLPVPFLHLTTPYMSEVQLMACVCHF
jgi:hypothetical protein